MGLILLIRGRVTGSRAAGGRTSRSSPTGELVEGGRVRVGVLTLVIRAAELGRSRMGGSGGNRQESKNRRSAQRLANIAQHIVQHRRAEIIATPLALYHSGVFFLPPLPHYHPARCLCNTFTVTTQDHRCFLLTTASPLVASSPIRPSISF